MQNPFTESRIRFLRSKSFDEFYELKAKDFLTTEIEYLISETPMRDEDKRMSVSFYIKCLTNQEVANVYNISIERAKQKKREIHDKLISTIIKMFFDYKNGED